MIRAGYIQRVGYPAQDRNGVKIQVLEIGVHNRIYVVSFAEIKRLLNIGGQAYVWTVRQNWGKILATSSSRSSIPRPGFP